MAKQPLETFSDRGIKRIFMAISTTEAREVEELLTLHDIEYAVEIEEYWTVGMLPLEKLQGAAFYVLSGKVIYCRDLLQQKNLEDGILDDDEGI